MFGYVVADKPNLRIKEYDTYKSVYCALCRRMGKDYGYLARLTLSYDFTFAAILGMSVRPEACSVQKGRCVCNPLKKCLYCLDDSDVLGYCAAAAMVLSEYKIRDNIEDSGFFKSVFYWCMYPLFRSWKKKAVKKYPMLSNTVEKYEEGQRRVELSEKSGLDSAAEPTALALKSIFSGLSSDRNKILLEKIGYCVGKWVYLADAGYDLEKDIKSGSFNPLKEEYKRQNETDAVDFAVKRLTPLMNCCMNDCAAAYDLLDIYKFKPILDNIIFGGMPSVFDKIKSKRDEKDL